MTAAPAVPEVLPELRGISRPRLRAAVPLLWRDASTIALGEHVVVDQVTRPGVAWLCSLDGARDAATVSAELTVDVATARRLLRAATAAAAVEDAAQVPDAIRWSSADDRGSAWGRFGAAVDTAGSVLGGIAMTAARELCTVAVDGDGPVPEAVRDALVRAGLRVVGPGPCSVTVLAGLAHPDVLPPRGEPDGPHLPVSVWGRRAVVGPLVVPGASSCLRCCQLHRRDADPAWPLLGVQWQQAVAGMAYPPVDPLLAALAAAHASALVRHWSEEPSAPVTDRALELTLPTATTRWLPRPAHPLCGCRWGRRPDGA